MIGDLLCWLGLHNGWRRVLRLDVSVPLPAVRHAVVAALTA